MRTFAIYVLRFFLKLRFKDIVEKGYIVRMGYMYPNPYEVF